MLTEAFEEISIDIEHTKLKYTSLRTVGVNGYVSRALEDIVKVVNPPFLPASSAPSRVKVIFCGG